MGLINQSTNELIVRNHVQRRASTLGSTKILELAGGYYCGGCVLPESPTRCIVKSGNGLSRALRRIGFREPLRGLTFQPIPSLPFHLPLFHPLASPPRQTAPWHF